MKASDRPCHYRRHPERRSAFSSQACVEYPWDEHWTRENRAIEADSMAANLADERVAIEEIKAALTAIVAMSPTRD